MPTLISPSIDVIIPAYNAQQYIVAALDSVFNQTYLPRQIIIVDDGSTDATAIIIKNYSSPIPINYIYKANGGLSSARNLGITESKADYIAFLDADDVWETTKLEQQVKIIQKSTLPNLGVIYCDYQIIDGSGNALPQFRSFQLDKTVRGDIFATLFGGNKIAGSGSAVLIKRSCFNQVGLFDESLTACEDWDMWLRLAQYFQFDYVDQKLVQIRRHSTNMSHDSMRLHLNTIAVLNKWSPQLVSGAIDHHQLTYEHYTPLVLFMITHLTQPRSVTQLLKTMNRDLRHYFLYHSPYATLTITRRVMKRIIKSND